ncbi:MAG: rhodanese-like domain-containing protein [Phycisphaerae bacterium]|nr:rhodanese-like domain-containing protein [Phycisphaerae bacterium]
MVQNMSDHEQSDAEPSPPDELGRLRRKNRTAFLRRLLIVGLALAVAAAIEWRREMAIAVIGRWYEIKAGAPAMGVSGALGLIYDENAVIVDVRSANEFAVSHLPGALSLDWDELRQRGWPPNWPVTRPVVVYCTRSDRSAPATAFLRERGIAASSLTGGILALAIHDEQLVGDHGQTWRVSLRASDHPWLLPKKYTAIQADIGQ